MGVPAFWVIFLGRVTMSYHLWKLYLVALIHGNLFCLFCGDRHILAVPLLTSIATFVARRKCFLPYSFLKAQPGRKMIPIRCKQKRASWFLNIRFKPNVIHSTLKNSANTLAVLEFLESTAWNKQAWGWKKKNTLLKRIFAVMLEFAQR